MSVFRRLFGGRASTSDDTHMSPREATEIIQRYGVVLEHAAPTPGCVGDVSKLPFPKNRIKQALIIGLGSTADPRMREMLKVGYLQLADWQEGVGPIDQGLDSSGIDADQDPLQLAKLIHSQSQGHKKWSPIVQAEQSRLKEELERQGLW